MNLGVGGPVPILPAALGAAGVGLDLSNIANNPDFSTAQKVGHGVGDTTNAVLGAVYPYYGLGLLANSIFGQLAQSGSPQVAATGRSLGQPLIPANGLMSVLQGDQSFRGAANSTVKQEEAVPLPAQIILSGLMPGMPTGKVLQWLGLGTPPTQGTMVRKEIGGVASQIPALKGFQMGQDVLTPDQYNTYKPETQKNAYALADLLGSYAPDYKKNQQAYQIQLGNSLLKQYGDNIPSIVQQILTPPQSVTPPAAPAPVGGGGWWSDPTMVAQWRSQFQNGLPNNSATGGAPNKLQGVMDTLR
jgi:hypothetical protein